MCAVCVSERTCECREMAFPRNWLNSLTPITLRTATTSGENTPVS